MGVRSYMTTRDETAALFPFLSLQGSPVPKAFGYERVIRAGVEGIGILRHALRGQPFAVTTFVDLADIDQVETTRDAYLAARGGVLDLWWQARLFDHVFIHAVQPQAWRQISGSVGGIVTDSTMILPAVWQLEAVT